MPESIHTVAVIGAGALGRQFALRCAAAGLDVILEDVMPAKLRRAEEELATLGPAAGSLSFALTVEEAVRHADIAVDFVPDELESKLEIFCMIDRMAPPRTVILTPSEALSITDLASCTYRPDRCFAIHGGLEARGLESGGLESGGLESGAPTRLIAPAGAAPHVASAVEQFLAAIGLPATTEPDAQSPMLVRGYL